MQKLIYLGLWMCVSASGAVPKGQTIYDNKCVICHASGMVGAPLFDDAPDWAQRLKATGKHQKDDQLNVFLDTVKAGKGMMPPKGTCFECSDADLKQAIDYLVFSKKGHAT